MTATFMDESADNLHTAHLTNGIRLAYEEAGQGLPLVFIHGVMGDWRSWDPQWSHFARHYRCVRYSRRYNYPNHNVQPSPDHSALQEAQDLRLLLDALEIEQAILVGSSYGSFTALALAVQAPERCLALALSEPPMMRYAERSAAGRQAREDFYARVVEPANAAFRQGLDEEGARIMTQGINGAAAQSLSGAAMQRRLQNMQAMKNLALSSDEFPWLAPQDLAALLMPILLMAGQNTPPIHSEIFRNVCAAMPQAEVQWIEAAGHGTSRDNPDVFNTLVSEFLDRRCKHVCAV